MRTTKPSGVCRLWILSFLLCSQVISCGGGPSSVDEYISTRDRYIEEIERQGDSADETGALADLERRLVSIVGPVEIDGFDKPARSNLATLYKEMGFGQLDGLRFDSDVESVSVTTKQLLDRYLAEKPTFPKALLELAKHEEFYLRALTEDAAVTYYAEMPLSSPDEKTFVHAFMGLVSQDTGPFPPSDLFVLFTHGDYVFVAKGRVESDTTTIQSCQEEYEDAAERNDEEFVACYSKEAKHQAFFPVLAAQAQSIVDRLQKAAR
jgi:hypothetical protein